MYDVMILGGGPAGRTAALYCARSALRCVVLEGTPGGQMALTQHVDNYPGLPDADGFALAQKMREQAQRAGAEFVAHTAESVSLAGNVKKRTASLQKPQSWQPAHRQGGSDLPTKLRCSDAA